MLKFKGTKTVQVEWKDHNILIEDYVDIDDQDFAKQYFSKRWVIVFGFEEVTECKSSENCALYEFAFDAEIADTKNLVKCAINVERDTEGKWQIKKAYDRVMNFYKIQDIKYIKPYGSNLDDNKLKLILAKLQAEQNQQLAIDKEKKAKVAIKEWESPEVITLRKEVAEFVDETRFLVDAYSKISLIEVKPLKEAIDNLLQYRRTSNIDKLLDVYQISLNRAERTWMVYLDLKEKEEVKNESSKVVNQIQVIKEYKKYQKVKRVATLEKVGGASRFMWYELIFYKVLWKHWIHLKLVWSEFEKKMLTNKWLFYDLFYDIELLILFIIVELLFLIWYSSMMSETVSLSIYYTIMQLWVVWISIWIFKFLSKSSLAMWILSILLVIIFYSFFNGFIKTNFAF